jgi:hypothetical protein
VLVVGDCALNHVRFRALALNPLRFRAAMHPILNYVEFRTNPEPYVVRGVVHGGVEKLILEIIRRRKKKR